MKEVVHFSALSPEQERSTASQHAYIMTKKQKSLHKGDRADVNHKNRTKKVNIQQAQSYCLTEKITKSLMAEGQRPTRSMIVLSEEPERAQLSYINFRVKEVKESTENIKD